MVILGSLGFCLYPYLKFLKRPIEPFKKKRSKSYAIYDHLLKMTSVLPGSSTAWADGIIAVGYILTAVILFNYKTFGQGVLLVGPLVGLIPYGLLRVYLSFKRIGASNEGESLVGELLKQYKLSARDMTVAIERSMVNLNHCPQSKRNLFRLLESLRAYQTNEDLLKALDTFTFAVDTKWMRLLSNNMYQAIIDGYNVTAGLEDILKELKIAKKHKEEEKRINFDGFLVGIILNPALYIGSIFMATKYFNIPIEVFFKRQITGSALKIFIVIVGLNVLCYLFFFMQKHTKLDY